MVAETVQSTIRPSASARGLAGRRLELHLVGATGNVGRKILKCVLRHRLFAPDQIRLFASARSVGATLSLEVEGRLHHFLVGDLNAADWSPGRERSAIVLFATESDISSAYAPKAMAGGCTVIDSSSYYRLDPSVPLVVGPVNAEQVDVGQHRLYAAANCLVSPLTVLMAPLHRAFPIASAHVVTYQSTSGAGKGPMDELEAETAARIQGLPYERQYFQRPIAFNLIPQVGEVLEDGFTAEEWKIIREIQKIVDPNLAVTATAVRVPVKVGHSMALTLRFKPEATAGLDRAALLSVLREQPFIEVQGDTGLGYQTPVEVEGREEVFVGRIRRDPLQADTWHFWVCSDNLHRGAATDAVEILRAVVSQMT